MILAEKAAAFPVPRRVILADYAIIGGSTVAYDLTLYIYDMKPLWLTANIVYGHGDGSKLWLSDTIS